MPMHSCTYINACICLCALYILNYLINSGTFTSPILQMTKRLMMQLTHCKSDLHLSSPVLAHCAPWYCLLRLGPDKLEASMESGLKCLSTYFSWWLQKSTCFSLRIAIQFFWGVGWGGEQYSLASVDLSLKEKTSY